MRRSVHFAVLLLLLIVIPTTTFLSYIGISKGIESRVESHANEQLAHVLNVVVSNFRSEILSGDIRGVRQRLESLRLRGLFNEFKIVEHEFEAQTGSTFPNPGSFRVPIFFRGDSSEGTEWGFIDFAPNREFVEEIGGAARRDGLAVALFVAIFTVGLQAIVLLVYGRSTTRMVTTVEDLYREQSPLLERARLTSLFWAPLLERVKLNHDSFKLLQAENERGRSYRAIAQMTQMLAHDVRKPLTMTKMAIDLIARAETPQELRAMKETLLRDVDQSLHSANSLISDVMEVGSDAEPTREESSLVSLIQSIVIENLRLAPETKVKLKYELAHSRMPLIDAAKIGRVLSNIFGNALQAIEGEEEIVFRTKDVERSGSQFVEVEIRNTGSRIPEEELPKLFEAFYTKGKKGGTGLGLAIAKKIIDAHGGEIRCLSGESEADPRGFVSFILTLPSGSKAERDLSKASLPVSAQDVLANTGLAPSTGSGAWSASQTDLEELANKIVKVAIVDDEGIYRSSVLEKISTLNNVIERFGGRVEAEVFKSGEDWLSAYETGGNFDLIILDIDMGEGLSGYEVLEKVKPLKPGGLVCVHSNRITAADQKKAIDLGADAFFPKPMSKEHLNWLIRAAAAKIEETSPSLDRFHIAVVDDTLAVRLIWKATTDFADVTCYESPEEFFAAARDDFDLVITDFHFGNASNLNGAEFAKKIRESGAHFPVVLSSNGELSEDKRTLFSAVVKKGPIKEEEIKQIILESISSKEGFNRHLT